MVKMLRSTQTVMAALGGTSATARITGAKRNAASNWLTAGVFPAWTYLLITQALAARGLAASPSLWPQMGKRDDACA
jgi:hypothetical protein